MDCERARETMALSVAGEIDAELARELARHLDSCVSCREEETALRGVAATFREEVPMPPAAARRGMRERVMGAVRAAKPEMAAGRRRPSALRRRMRAPRARQFAWMLPLAAAASVLVVWAAYFQGPDEDARAPAVAGREEPPGADRVVEGPTPTEERPAGAVAARPEELPAPAREESPAAEELVELAGLVEPAPAPERAAPTPVAPAPDETPQVVASLSQIEGPVHYRRGGAKWNRAVERIKLVGGDELDTRTGLAAVGLESGGRVLCNRGSWAAFEAGKVHLHRGEVFCEFGPADGVAVATADGVVRHVGTRFSVKALPAGTVVTVEEGSVMVECGGAAARVREGFEVKLRRGLAPGEPRKADVRTVLSWLRGLRPRVLYSMQEPRPDETAVDVPGVGAVPSLDGWSFRLGAAWTVTEAPRPQPGLGALRWQPARRGEYRSHAVVGEPTWADYEVAFAFRVAPGSIGGTANSVSAIVYQGEDQLEVYRLGVWGLHGPDAKLRCVRGFGGNTTVELPWRMVGGGRVQVRPGSWYRVRFGVRTRRDRVELRGKLWPAASAEPAGWSCIAADRSAERLASGRAGVGLQALHAEVTEFAVRRLADW